MILKLMNNSAQDYFSRTSPFSRRAWLKLLLAATGCGTFASFAEDGREAWSKKMLTIGVIGLGARAAVDFQMHIHQASQKLITPRTPVAYPPTMVMYHRRPPVVVNDDFSTQLPVRVDPRLLELARSLGELSDFVVMSANGPHLFHREIERAAGKPLLSMIDATIAEVRRRGWRRVGALGFLDENVPVYRGRLRELGLQIETIEADLQRQLNAAVFQMMEGSENENSREIARRAVSYLRSRKVDGIIPGCTEIPLLLGEAGMADDLVNPAALLAEAAVKRAIDSRVH